MLAAGRQAACNCSSHLVKSGHGCRQASSSVLRLGPGKSASLSRPTRTVAERSFPRVRTATRPPAQTAAIDGIRHRICFSTTPSLSEVQSDSAALATEASIGKLLRRYRAGADDALESQHRVLAFARSVRKHRTITFLSLADGSLDGNETLEAVLGKNSDIISEEERRLLAPGVAVEMVGKLKKVDRPHEVEFVIESLQVTGECHAATYPVPLTAVAKRESQDASSTTAETSAPDLRRFAHLRPREVRHVNVLKMRSTIERAIDAYFAEEDFVRVAAPIITASDCEGGGEVFRVTRDEEGKDPNEFWSGSRAYLTVSAQLHLEALTQGLGRVCTTGPAFRAEGSATNRHLAEFWMCEAEQMTVSQPDIALTQVMDTVEHVVRSALQAALRNERAVTFLWRDDAEGLEEIQFVADPSHQWRRVSYTEAVGILQQAEKLGVGSEIFPDVTAPQWGESLSSEHERYLAKDGPIFITNYPAATKPFYMKRDVASADDRSTVACFDLLAPGLGELAGGSLRETNSRSLLRQMAETGMITRSEAASANASDASASANASDASAATSGAHADKTLSLPQDHPLGWYNEIRRYGAAPTGGFGIGVERLVAWLTNTNSLRDVVTFPRVKGPLRY